MKTAYRSLGVYDLLTDFSERKIVKSSWRNCWSYAIWKQSMPTFSSDILFSRDMIFQGSSAIIDALAPRYLIHAF